MAGILEDRVPCAYSNMVPSTITCTHTYLFIELRRSFLRAFSNNVSIATYFLLPLLSTVIMETLVIVLIALTGAIFLVCQQLPVSLSRAAYRRKLRTMALSRLSSCN